MPAITMKGGDGTGTETKDAADQERDQFHAAG